MPWSVEKGGGVVRILIRWTFLLFKVSIKSFTFQVRYGGTLTYLKSENREFKPGHPRSEDADQTWAQVVDGKINVYVCPGDHFSMSEMSYAETVGGILATAVNFKYCALFPELHSQPRSFKHRRAVQKFQSGVGLFLHSKKGTVFMCIFYRFVGLKWDEQFIPYLQKQTLLINSSCICTWYNCINY